ncbi:MAG: outer membrane protein assembly factor BamA [Acidobacteria bacterium]|nr:outer membrane protein assembly factor BamA [Acidobacteriota bacterium]
MPKVVASALAFAALLTVGASAASAQSLAAATLTTPDAPTICGAPVPEPANLPPAESGPVVYFIAPCFLAQGNVSAVEPQTYLYYMQLRPSQPSQNVWVPWDEEAERTAIADHARLWATGFLSNLSIEVTDYTFANGVIGKLVTYQMEERQRVKIVTYDGTSAIDRAAIDEQLRARGIEMRLDAFVNNGMIRRVETVLRDMMAEKGFTDAGVSHEVTEVAGGPKLVNVTFRINEGPKIKIRDIDFVGNVAKSNRTLRRKMKNNKTPGFFGFITRGGTYKSGLFEMDADLIQAYYRDEGYVQAQVGQPEIKVLEETADGKTRWVQLVIPVVEGERFRVGSFSVDGNKVVRSEVLEPIFEVAVGDWYSEGSVREGLVKAQEMYGAGGYMEFTGFPDIIPVDDGSGLVPDAIAAPPSGDPPTVDVTMRLQEGEQYLVNRMTFVGNTTTRDHVIRREMRLVEGSIFNTEALKYSVRRINQLGYFEQLNEEDQTAIQVDKTPGRTGAVDVTVNLREQNRNQLTFGAGVSQYEGVFGQLGFQTANFLGRGKTLNVSMQAGSRSQNYQLAFTEPFLFDRNITAGFDVYKRSLQYIGFYTQRTTGANVTVGFPVADFSRMFFNYSNERIQMADLNEAFLDPNCIFSADGCSDISLTDLSTINPDVLEGLRRNPFIFDSLLIGEGGRRTVSKLTPSFVHNTVDNPIFPNTGRKLTASIDLAVLGGNTQFYRPSVEAVQFFRHTSRTTLGVRSQFQFIAPVRNTTTLPIFEKLVSGGEYSVRGYDIRSIGPSDPATGLVLGGNKSLVFNVEYMFSIVPQVRLIAFYDAAQVVAERRPFAMDQFRTSTGAEIRFFMPVLNVPFRLIFAANPQRDGVRDNRLQPAKSFVFRFAVGSTF